MAFFDTSMMEMTTKEEIIILLLQQVKKGLDIGVGRRTHERVAPKDALPSS